MSSYWDRVRDPRCKGCPLHLETRRVCYVTGTGHRCRVLFVGEAPGEEEERRGKPFVGRSGWLLRQLLDDADWTTPYAITNTVWCRPPDNRTPKLATEARLCSQSHLLPAIRHQKPTLIVCLGSVAAKTLTGDFTMSMQKMRGRIRTIEIESESRKYNHTTKKIKINVVGTYHPAAVLRMPGLYPIVLEDFRWFQQVLAGTVGEVSQEKSRLYRIDETVAVDFGSSKRGVMALDLETTTFSPHEKGAKILCCALSAAPLTACAFSMTKRHVVSALQRKLKNRKITKVGHNLKFDLVWLRHLGIEVKGPLFDTMVAFHLISEDYPDLSLEHLAAKFTPMGYYAQGMKEKRGTFTEVTEELLEYCAMDADATRRLRDLFIAQLRKQRLTKTFRLLMRTLRTLTEMETTGVYVDRTALDGVSNEMQDRREVVRETLRTMAPDLNPKSTQQLSRFLYETMGLKAKHFTAKGFPSTSEEALIRLQEKQDPGSEPHEFLTALLEHRKLIKLETAFFAPLRDKFLTRKGLIYPQYLLTGTVTGRLSCRNPNMQQIPPEVKGVFSSRHGDGMIVQADFSQIELRVMAELAQEHSMIHVFERDGDIHTATASKIFGIVEDDIEEWQRAIGKRVNFGVLYGMAAAKMTQVANVTYEMAQDFLARYWKAHPSVRRWALSVRREAIVHRRVRGLLGRVRHIPVMDPESKEGQHQLRQAVNFPVQWGAAAITYMALNRVRLALRGMRSDLIATVHDSMVLDCPKEEAVEVCGIVQSICENPGLAEWGLEFTVPLRAKVSMGPTWGDLQEV